MNPTAQLLCVMPELFPPAWAGGWGADTRGVYAELLIRGVACELRWIPPGSFLMGSPDGEVGRRDAECPQHLVTITQGFWLAATPCTQEFWQALTGENPSHSNKRAPGLPVENIDWNQVSDFCQRLTEQARVDGCLPGHFEFRLPSEAEWEYACRAGTGSAFNDGSDCTQPAGKDLALEKLGWHGEGEKGQTHPVGEKLPNAWGLYDMHGNVWEWCLDGSRQYVGQAQIDPLGPMTKDAWRVLRGGAYWSLAGLCRSAFRHEFEPGYRFVSVGFRLAAGQELGK